MFLALLSLLALSLPQEPAPPPGPTASVPVYANPSCPIMGKPVSLKLFTDTAKGRIWICCKSCIKDIQADVEVAYRSAYPADKKLDNKLCPVSGDPIKEDSPKTVLQGFEFFVHAPQHVAAARENAQIVLAKLNDPKLVDLGNPICPVSGTPVVANAFVVINGTLVRLSSPKLMETIEKDPAAVLKRAKELGVQRGAAPKKPGDAK